MGCALALAAAQGGAPAETQGPSAAVPGVRGPALSLEAVPEGLDADVLARRADDNMRSASTYFHGRMTVESPRLATPRSITFESWEDRGGKRSFVRILAPPRDAGTGFLKLGSNLWMYIPRVERTMRVPPSMMLQSWMGSDFTNDDLVRESSEVEDYDHRLLGVDPSVEEAPGRRAYVLAYVPHEDAAVVWGRIIAWIDAETLAPLRQEFYDEDGEKLRVLRFTDHRRVGTRTVPFLWTLTPLDKPGHRTAIEVLEIRFDVELDESIFTRRHLERSDRDG